jgi:hypothetical protein
MPVPDSRLTLRMGEHYTYEDAKYGGMLSSTV